MNIQTAKSIPFSVFPFVVENTFKSVFVWETEELRNIIIDNYARIENSNSSFIAINSDHFSVFQSDSPFDVHGNFNNPIYIDIKCQYLCINQTSIWFMIVVDGIASITKKLPINNFIHSNSFCSVYIH